jgi:hypothetical protein
MPSKLILAVSSGKMGGGDFLKEGTKILARNTFYKLNY